MASMIIHSGLLPLVRKASTTLRRLMAFWRFWPLRVVYYVAQVLGLFLEVDLAMRSLTASAPMPPRKYTP